MNIDSAALAKEFQFKTSRSGGKGGQHVNKVETKVELLWDYQASGFFSDEEKHQIALALKNRINKEGMLQVVAEEERTQLKNKHIAVHKTIKLISESLKEQKKRKPGKPGKSAVKNRLDDKRKQALKKINRGERFDF